MWGLSVSGQTATFYTFMFQSCLQDLSSYLWVWRMFIEMLCCGCLSTASWIFHGWYGWKYCGLKFIVLRTQHEMWYVYTFAFSGESRGWASEAQAPSPYTKNPKNNRKCIKNTSLQFFYKFWESPSDFSKRLTADIYIVKIETLIGFLASQLGHWKSSLLW